MACFNSCFLFSFIFSGLATMISLYRGKTSILEYSLAGMLTGAAFKFSLGPKGMVSGGMSPFKQ